MHIVFTRGSGTQFTDQATQTHYARVTRSLDGAARNQPNLVFMHDQLALGSTLTLFNVIDDLNREAIGMVIEFSLPSERVIRELYKSSLGGASLKSDVVTTGLITSVQRYRHGPRVWESGFHNGVSLISFGLADVFVFHKQLGQPV